MHFIIKVYVVNVNLTKKKNYDPPSKLSLHDSFQSCSPGSPLPSGLLVYSQVANTFVSLANAILRLLTYFRRFSIACYNLGQNLLRHIEILKTRYACPSRLI